VVVQLHTDAGVTGLGEMSDVNWEPDDASVRALADTLEPLLLGRDLMARGPLMEDLARHDWEHQVLCGVDIAVHDAVARALQVPLHELLGGAFRHRLPFAYPLAPCRDDADVQANLGRVERRMGEGHPGFRYYFGMNLDCDEAFLESARHRWGDGLRLVALDASGRFEPADAVSALRRLATFGPQVFESPVRGRHDAPVEDFLAVRAEIDIPISEHTADEAVALRLARGGAIDVFNTGLGYAGIEPCRRTFGLARQFGLRALMGSTVEMSIGTAARAHVAAATANLDLGCYMAGPLVYAQDIAVESVRYEEGHIVVPAGPGLGVELDPQKLESLRP
jgi:muconate cycloisomerase